MKRTAVWSFLGLVAFLLILWGDVQVASAQKTIKFKFASVMQTPDLNMASEVAFHWQELVTKRTKGAITFENFWGASLGAPPEHIDLLKTGVVQAIQTYCWYTPSRMPFADFEWVFPFGPTDHGIAINAERQMRTEFPQFAKELENQNALYMVGIAQGEYYFSAKVPLRSIDDFKGKKVALVGRYFGRWLPPGATAVVRPAHERYDLLKTGVVQADLSTFDNLYAFKTYEVANQIVRNLPLMTGVGMPVLFNLDAFKKLSPELQKILLEAGQDTEKDAINEIVPRWRQKAFKDWEAAGAKFIDDFPQKDRLKWIEGLEDIPAEWATEMEGKGLPGFKLVQRWQEVTTGLGYQWPRRWGIKK
jgi:TRAP-type C4-dicarboxylate transport system substrate-binding protein